MNYLVKTHKFGTRYKGPHFFVLNRGRNTGKVLHQECPNCWVIQTDEEETAERLQYIIGALHMSHKIRRMLIGSVIMYVRISDFRKLLKSYTTIIQFDEKWDADLIAIREAIKLRDTYLQQRKLLDMLLQVRYYNLLKGL
jgi:hypothetical protein